VVAADELDFSRGDSLVGIVRADVKVVVDAEAVFFPASRLVDNVQKGQVAVGAIGEFDLIHVSSSDDFYPPSQKTTAARPWMNAGADPPKLEERRRVLRRISPKE
jgi:hypothetical protein